VQFCPSSWHLLFCATNGIVKWILNTWTV
jgi:hypothetical protein